MEKERQVGELIEQDPKVKRRSGPENTEASTGLINEVINEGRHDADVCCTGNDLILGRINFLRCETYS